MNEIRDIFENPPPDRQEETSGGVQDTLEKLAGLEKAHEKMKAVNDYFRQHGSLDGCPQLLRSETEELKATMARYPHQRVRQTHWKKYSNRGDVTAVASPAYRAGYCPPPPCVVSWLRFS